MAHQASCKTDGSPRVHAEWLARGEDCNQETVEKYMQQADIWSKTARKFRVSTTDSNHPHPIAPNLVNRNFTPSAKNETWTTDITYIASDEGWLRHTGN